MSKLIALLCLLPLLSACAVKKRGAADESGQPITSSTFPNGISESDHGKLLVYLPAQQFTPYKWNTLDFHLTDLNLTPLDSADYEFTVNYFMPDMPAMHIDDPTWKLTSPGVLEVTLNISMPGNWKVWITVSHAGATVDTYTRTFFVPFTR